MKRKGRLPKNYDESENGDESHAGEENGEKAEEKEDPPRAKTPSKGRGRPKKLKSYEESDSNVSSKGTDSEDNNQDDSATKSRGRKRTKTSYREDLSDKEASPEPAQAEGEREKSVGRGRPKKSKKNPETESTSSTNGTENDAEKSKVEKETPSKGRGRKKQKKSTNKEDEAAEEPAEYVDEGESYEVEKIVDHKMLKGVKLYLIRWKNYGQDSDTWEPENTLDCAELLSEYNAKKKSRKEKKKVAAAVAAVEAAGTWDENQDFEVDKVLDVYFKRDGSREFLVSWKNYPASMNSWEPEENMDCKDLIKKFMGKVEKARQATTKELRVNRKHTDRFTLSTQAMSRRLSKRHLGKQRVTYHEAE